MSYPRQTSDNFELLRALKRKDKEIAELLIRCSNVNVNNPAENGNTLLHLAIAFFGDTDIITMLLDKGANIHALNNLNETPLCKAIESNTTKAASLLIRKGGLVEENLYSALVKAICRNNSTIVELIDTWMESKPSIDLRTYLNTAISQGNSKIIECILPRCQFLEPSDKYIPRKAVISSGTRYKDCVKLLLKWNFTINPNSYQDKGFIFAAVEKGYLPIVLQLLEFGIDVNVVDLETRLNLLTVACLFKHHEIVENLLKHGADVNVKTSAKNSKLLEQSYLCHGLQSFNYLFPPGHQNQLGDITCLHIAVLNSDSKMLEVLLKYNPTIDNRMAFKLTCIAAHHGCEDIVRSFLNRGVDVTDTDSEGRSLLHYCAPSRSTSGSEDSRFNGAKLILEKAANVIIQNSSNKFVPEKIQTKNRKIPPPFLHLEVGSFSFNDTLLHKVIRNEFDAKFIPIILDHKFPVEVTNKQGLTPLHLACEIPSKNQLEYIAVLLKHNADINCKAKNSMTPLHIASREKNLEVVTLLLRNGAEPDAMDEQGRTPLHMVCAPTTLHGNITIGEKERTKGIILLLLQYRANIEAESKRNLTPLTMAYLYDNKTAVKCLLKNHAKDNFIYSENSAFHFVAIQHKCSYVMKNLIKFGADINTLDKENRTPLEYATQRLKNLNHSLTVIIKLLKTQVVKLKVAGLNVFRQSLNLVYNSDDNEDRFIIDVPELEVKCQQEIEKMKMKSIGHDNKTLYDLLKKSITILSRLDGNEEIQEALEQEDYDQEFPLYIDIVRSKVREAKIRYTLMNSARECFSVNVCQYLPYECIDLILSYLKCKELNMFIEAMMPPKN